MTDKADKKENQIWREAFGGYIPKQEERGYKSKSSSSQIKPPKGGTGESDKK
jgi:hypothetical protein